MGVSFKSMPDTMVIGFSNGGNFLAPMKALLGIGPNIAITVMEAVKFATNTAANATELDRALTEINEQIKMFRAEGALEIAQALAEIEGTLIEMRSQFDEINYMIADWDESRRNYQS